MCSSDLGNTNDNSLALSGIVVGSLAADEVVKVYDGARLLGQASVADDGQSWSFLTPSLANGAHSFTARVVDAAGNLGQASASHSVNVSADTPSGTVTISSSTPAASNNVTPTIQGTATGAGEGDLVAIYDGRTLLGTVSASANWSYTVPSALAEGPHAITAVLQNAGGNQGAPSAPYSMLVDTVAPTLTIVTDDSALKIGDQAKLTFIFSEAPLSSAPVVTASNGTVGSLTEIGRAHV